MTGATDAEQSCVVIDAAAEVKKIQLHSVPTSVVPLSTAVTEVIGKGSTKEWISKSFYKQEDDALVLIQGAATSNNAAYPNSELPYLLPDEPSQAKAVVSNTATEVGMTSKDFLPATNVQIDGRMKTLGNLQNHEIVQISDKSPIIAQVQQTCAATALVQQPARKNKKVRKHANDPPAKSNTVTTSNIQYATGIDLCEKNKMAHTVPSQSPNREQSEKERSANNQNTCREIEQQ